MRRNIKLIVFVSIIWMFVMVYYFQSSTEKVSLFARKLICKFDFHEFARIVRRPRTCPGPAPDLPIPTQSNRRSVSSFVQPLPLVGHRSSLRMHVVHSNYLYPISQLPTTSSTCFSIVFSSTRLFSVLLHLPTTLRARGT